MPASRAPCVLHTPPSWKPGQCAVCRSWGARLCRACLDRFAPPCPRCPACALPLPSPGAPCPDCLRVPPPFERSVAALDYAWPWDRLIGDLKFHDGLGHCAALVPLLAAAVRQAEVLPVDLLLPMPLSPQRLRQRGYNQAWEVARRLGRLLGIAAEARLLLRLLDTPHQLGLPRAQRAGNVRGAFGVDPLRGPLALRGRRVALVDDVMTTGASAAEAARVLRDAGAAAVQAWVLARTARPEDA